MAQDNVTSRSDNMPWYCGPTLIEVAASSVIYDSFVQCHKKSDMPN